MRRKVAKRGRATRRDAFRQRNQAEALSQKSEFPSCFGRLCTKSLWEGSLTPKRRW